MGIYEEVRLEDMAFDAAESLYSYQCPCGDFFQIYLVRHPASTRALYPGNG